MIEQQEQSTSDLLSDTEKDLLSAESALLALPKLPQRAGLQLPNHSPYTFHDHLWRKSEKFASEFWDGEKVVVEWEYTSEEMISLVNIAVRVTNDDTIMVRNKGGHHWESFKRDGAFFDFFMNEYSTDQYVSLLNDPGPIFTNTDPKIDLMWNGMLKKCGAKKEGVPSAVKIRVGTLPAVRQVVDYPLHPEFLLSDKFTALLNIGHMYRSLDGKADFKLLGLILRMIYVNLCNYTPTLDEQELESSLIKKVMFNEYSDDEKDFKFVMHWCAALVQNPGINLMTNIWFAGYYQGIGKGTLVNLLRAILGADYVGQFKKSIITNGFNAPIAGKMLLEINERQKGISPDDMTDWLKSVSQETQVSVEKKGKDVYMEKSMLNIIGTAQDPADVFKLEDGDRRNILFSTLPEEDDEDESKKAVAVKVACGVRDYPDDWGGAFAWALERFEVDMQLISKVYQTRGYADAKQEQQSSMNPLYLWAAEFFYHPELSLDGCLIKTSELHKHFNNQAAYVCSQITFNKRLKDLVGVKGIRPFKLEKKENILMLRFDKKQKEEKKGGLNFEDVASESK